MSDVSSAERLEVRTFPEPDASIIQKIDGILIALNQQTLKLQRKAMVIALYDKDEFTGGVYFRWYGESAMLDYMAVEEKWRNQGVGKRLVLAAEKEMLQQGCRQILVDTMAFQAPGFYQHMGYEITATITDYYGSHDRIILRKRLP